MIILLFLILTLVSLLISQQILVGFTWFYTIMAALVVCALALEHLESTEDPDYAGFNMAPLLILGGLFVLNFVIVILRRRRLKRGA